MSAGEPGPRQFDPARERRYFGGFRTVQPSVAGWLALLVPGALIGVLLTAFLPAPWPVGAIIGAVVAWVVAVVLDKQKFERGFVSYHIDVGNVAELDQIVADLRSNGVLADPETWIDPRGEEHFLLRVRQRDRAAVEAHIGWL